MLSDIKNEIKGLNSNKAKTYNNIPTKIIRQSAEFTANTLQLLFNNAISNSEFPESLKLADVTLAFKKKDPLDKTNYRPVSVLPPVSKIFERLMQKQVNEHIKNKSSPYNWNRTHNHLVRKRTINHLAKLARIFRYGDFFRYGDIFRTGHIFRYGACFEQGVS